VAASCAPVPVELSTSPGLCRTRCAASNVHTRGPAMRWTEQDYLDYLKRQGMPLTPAHSAKNKKEKPPNIVYLQDKATHGVMTHEEQASTLGRSALSPTPRASSHQEDEPMRSTVTLPLFLPPLPQQILCQLALPGEPGTKARPRFC